MRRISCLVIAAALAAIWSCGSDSGPPVSFKADVAPLVGTCMGQMCHTGPTQSENCGSGQSGCVTFPYSTLVNVKAMECSDGRLLVKPGDSANSYLIQKLRGVDMCTCCRMPLETAIPLKQAPPLTDAQIQTIADWIDQGAPNN